MPSIAEIGDRLKKAREARSLAIDQVQKQTHIHSTVLTALEEGRCDELLTPTYVKSFLKSYSHFLGLDSKQIVKDYLAVHPEFVDQNINKAEAKDLKGLSNMIRAGASIMILIASVLLIVFVGKKVINYFKNPRFVKSAPLARRKLNTATLPIKVPFQKKSPLTAPQTQTSIPKTVPLNLVLKVNKPVLVQVKKDGVLLFKRVLYKGAIESFTADDNIILDVAKAEAVELVLNGKELNLPNKGPVKDLKITRKGIKAK